MRFGVDDVVGVAGSGFFLFMTLDFGHRASALISAAVQAAAMLPGSQ
jgi:hypothetical protein